MDKLKTKDSSFTVRTPVALAGVRGSDVGVDQPEGGPMTFAVVEGSGYVASNGEQQPVEARNSRDVSTDGEIQEQEEIPPDQLNEMKAVVKTEKKKAEEGAPIEEGLPVEEGIVDTTAEGTADTAVDTAAEGAADTAAEGAAEATVEAAVDSVVESVIENVVDEVTIDNILDEILDEILECPPGGGCSTGIISF